jgi:hypothetical protein
MAIITADEYETYDGLPSPTENVEQIAAAVDLATALIEKEAGKRTFALDGEPSPLDNVEILNSKGTNRVWTKDAPIQAVSKIEYWNGTAWQEYDSTSYPYMFIPGSNCVYFTDGHKFPEGWRNIRVTFEYGFDDDYPDDLKLACYQLAKHIVNEADRQGILIQSDGEQKFHYRDKLPELAMNIARRYKTIW